MASAERLLDLITFWMGHRMECADYLSLAAGELLSACKNRREMQEFLESSSSIRNAKQQDQMTTQIWSDIQQLFEQLKEQTRCEHMRDVNQSVTEELLQSLGKRGGFSEDELNFESLITTDEAAPNIDRTLTTNLLKILAFFSSTEEGEGLEGYLKEGLSKMNNMKGMFPSITEGKFEELLRHDNVTNLNQSLHGGAENMMKVVEELRMAFRCISEAFAELKDVEECIVDPGCVCRRSKLLQYAHEHCKVRCREPDESNRGHSGKSGDTEKPSQLSVAFSQTVVSQAPRFRTRGQARLVEHAIRLCRNDYLRAWLQEEGNTDAFLGLVDLFHMMKRRLYRERRQRRTVQSREIDIIFVAHGSITDRMIPSEMLLPLPSLLDVVLYQPWNCTINALVAYGIAAGTIEPNFCRFICDPNSCPHSGLNHDQHHMPTPPSSTWNHMSQTVSGIPEINLSPLNAPHDAAWSSFRLLKRHNRYPERDRVLIPFLLPRLRGTQVPFSLVTLALSLVLKFSGLKGRLHLAACLGNTAGAQLDMEYLASQYCITPDNTMMTSTQDLDMPTEEDDQELYKLFKDLFG